MTKFIVNGKQGYKTYHDWKAFWGMKGAPSTPPVPPGPGDEAFYMEDMGSGMRVSIKKMTSAAPTVPVEYSLDGTTWQSLGSTSTTALTIDIPSRGKVWLRAVTDAWTSNYNDYNTINTTNNAFNIGGNILSLLYGSNYKEATTITQSYAFGRLFEGSRVYDASELILPDTQPSEDCYNMMFYNCRNLRQAPALPATTLAIGCYGGMFSGCNNLQQAPALPATTLAKQCYSNMFSRCTSLTTAPTLPATTMFMYCYDSMFYGCYHLQQVPALPATTLAYGCYMNMFNGCYILSQAQTILPATTLAQNCYAGMFQGCSSLTAAPILPATTLVYGCYHYMFSGCSWLQYIKCLAVEDENYMYDFRDYYCLDWVNGVSGSGTFIASDNYSSGWYWGSSGVPEGWTAQTESGNPFVPSSGGGGTQIYQSNGLTVYEMGSGQGGYSIQANGSTMEVPDFNSNDWCFAMMKISSDQGRSGNDAYMTPYLRRGVTAYISYEVEDDGNCPFSYSNGDEYDYEYALTNNDDGNQVSPHINEGYCRWVKFVKNQDTYSQYTPYIEMYF